MEVIMVQKIFVPFLTRSTVLFFCLFTITLNAQQPANDDCVAAELYWRDEGGGRASHTPAPTTTATAAPFQA